VVEVGPRRAMSQNTHPSTIGARSDILLAKRLPPKQKVFLMAQPRGLGRVGIRWEWERDSVRRGVDLTYSTATLPDAAAGSGSGMPPSCRSSELVSFWFRRVCDSMAQELQPVRQLGGPSWRRPTKCYWVGLNEQPLEAL